MDDSVLCMLSKIPISLYDSTSIYPRDTLAVSCDFITLMFK